jgi:hypothetical protein
VADHMFAHNNEVHWDLNFIKLVHDWEVDFVSSFSILFILSGGVGEMKTSFVGFLPKDELSRLKHFTNFFSPILTTLSLGRAFRGLRLL